MEDRDHPAARLDRPLSNIGTRIPTDEKAMIYRSPWEKEDF
jgi:hypothetical protein